MTSTCKLWYASHHDAFPTANSKSLVSLESQPTHACVIRWAFPPCTTYNTTINAIQLGKRNKGLDGPLVPITLHAHWRQSRPYAFPRHSNTARAHWQNYDGRNVTSMPSLQYTTAFFYLKKLYFHIHKCASSVSCLRLYDYWKNTQNKRLMNDSRREGIACAEWRMFQGGARSALQALLIQEQRVPS